MFSEQLYLVKNVENTELFFLLQKDDSSSVIFLEKKKQ